MSQKIGEKLNEKTKANLIISGVAFFNVSNGVAGKCSPHLATLGNQSCYPYFYYSETENDIDSISDYTDSEADTLAEQCLAELGEGL